MSEKSALPGALGPLAKLADWCVRRRWQVVGIWALSLVAGLGLLFTNGGDFTTDTSTGGSESQHAYEVLQDRFPALGGDSIDVVVYARAGVRDASVKRSFEALLARAATTPHVTDVRGPYSPDGSEQIAPGGRVAYATLQLDLPAADVPPATVERVIALATAANSPELDIDLAGAAVSQAQDGPPSEAIAMGAAAVVLLLAFGSLLAMGLPIITAVFGLGIAAAVVGLLMNVVDVASTAPAIAAMVGMGVGIDYALLILARCRGYLAQGWTVRAAVVAAESTAGRAVIFAGATVIVSLLGMFLMREKSMYGLTIATVVAVLAMVIASVTLLPALLSIAGRNLDRLRVPGLGRGAGRSDRSSLAYRWSGLVLRHPWPAAIASTLLLLVLAFPVLFLRLGLPDAGNDPKNYTTRQAFDRLSEGFGPGFNGPLVLAAELPQTTDVRRLETLAERDLPQVPGVASVSRPLLSPGRDVAVIEVIPTTGPQDAATADLVHRLRHDALGVGLAGTGIRVSVGGATAAGVDMTTALGERLPWFIGASVLFSIILLTVLLRSPVIAAKAAVLNLLSVGAAFGVVSFAISGSWLGELIGIPEQMPAPAYAPLLMFAILFGLSMDYEIFLMSRIREEYVRGEDNDKAIASGLAATAPVITAAAAVMVAIFGGFIFSQEVFLKAVGIGLASAILIDATVIRLMLVPAAMKLLGNANWWLPAWLDRWLPEVSAEGREPVLLPESSVPSQGRHRVGRTYVIAQASPAGTPYDPRLAKTGPTPGAVQVGAASSNGQEYGVDRSAPTYPANTAGPADQYRRQSELLAIGEGVKGLAEDVAQLRAEVRQLVSLLNAQDSDARCDVLQDD